MVKKRSNKRSTRRVKRRVKKRGMQNKSKFHIAIQKLKQMNLKQQRQALMMSNDTFIRQLCAKVKKLRHQPMSASLKKRMQKQKKKLQKFVLPKTSATMRRKMLTQRGGFLPLLISALPAVGALVGNIIAGARRRS